MARRAGSRCLQRRAPLRVSGFNVAIISQWMDPRENDRCIAWCRGTFDALKPFLAETRYVNYLDHDEAGDPAAAAYGVNYTRLRELKAKIRSRELLPRERQHPPGSHVRAFVERRFAQADPMDVGLAGDAGSR